ncbi:MAG: helix-turn-helix transcriptional regulator [Candidatus Heimdallarchaeaceae archaeon]
MEDTEYTKLKEFLFMEFVDLEDTPEHIIAERLSDMLYNSSYEKDDPEVIKIIQAVTEHYSSGFNSATNLSYLLGIASVFGETKMFMVWFMKEVQKREYKEIAQLMKIAESTVRDHYRNAEKRLKKNSIRVSEYYNIKHKK